MRKLKNTLFVTVLAILLSIFACAASMSTSAFAYSKIAKVLFVVEDEAAYQSLVNKCAENPERVDQALFDIRIGYKDLELSSYQAVAIQYDGRLPDDLIGVFNSGTTVYLYGDLTIQDYKSAVDIKNFSVNVEVDSLKGQTKTVHQYFNRTYEETERFNVVSYGIKPLLCRINGDDILLAALYNIVENFKTVYSSLHTRTTIVKSQFDHVTSWGIYSWVASVHMDYTLYQNFDEQDPSYDYFGIKTKVWKSGDGDLTKLYTKYALEYSSDNLLETGPASQSSIGSLSVSIGFGNSGASGSVGYSVDLSDTKPKITRTENYNEDWVEWTLQKRFWFPPSLEGTQLDCVATWASTGHYAQINVSYQASAVIGKAPTGSTVTTIPVTFSY